MAADDPYRPPETTSSDAASIGIERNRRARFAAGLVCAIAAAAFSTLSVPIFRDIYGGLAFELPFATRLLTAGYPLTWLLPVIVVACWWARPQAGNRGMVVFAIGVGGGVALIAAVAFALYLPLFTLSRSL